MTRGQTAPPVSLRAPQLLSASVFERCLCRSIWSKDILRISLTSSKHRVNSVVCRPKGHHWKEQCILVGGHASSVPSAQAVFWPRLDVHGLSVAAGSLTCPGCSSATSLAHAAPDWRSARVRFNETEATPKAGRSVLTSEHLCHMHRV